MIHLPKHGLVILRHGAAVRALSVATQLVIAGFASVEDHLLGHAVLAYTHYHGVLHGTLLVLLLWVVRLLLLRLLLLLVLLLPILRLLLLILRLLLLLVWEGELVPGVNNPLVEVLNRWLAVAAWRGLLLRVDRGRSLSGVSLAFLAQHWRSSS